MAHGSTAGHDGAPGPAGEPGLAGVVTVFTGCLLVLLSFSLLHWYATGSGADSAGTVGFVDLHNNVDALGGTPIAAAYFDWLGWVALIVMPLIGTAANLPTRWADPLRVTGFLLGLIGSATTFYAIDQLFHAQAAAGGTRSVWRNSTFGLWAALLGFVVAGVGAALGPRRAPAGSDTIGS